MSVFICAEIGVNWRDLVDADDMIREAAKAGADAVKFQAYKEIEEGHRGCDGGSNGDEWYVPPAHPRAKELNDIALDESTIRYLYWRCRQHGVEFMCTPMYPEAVAMLNPYVKRWKIRCADKDNEELISLCKATGKTLLISGKNIMCISEYPPSNIDYCGKGYEGFSCHFPYVEKAFNGAKLPGFEYLEVHVRLDKYEPQYCPIDTKVSITMSELKELCDRLK